MMNSIVFFNDTATTEIYTLSLHDALPIFTSSPRPAPTSASKRAISTTRSFVPEASPKRKEQARSEEHTSELQSRQYLVCRLLLEKKHHLQPQSDECVHDTFHRADTGLSAE